MRRLLSKAAAQWQYAWLGRPDRILYYGSGIGDDLMCTAVLRELKLRGASRLAMLTRYKELFEANRDVSTVVDWSGRTMGRLKMWGYPATAPYYAEYDPARDCEIVECEHFITTMCKKAGITGPISIRPWLQLSDREKAEGRIADFQIVVQSAGRAEMKNKEWLIERYQAVCDALSGTARVIQLGHPSEPAIVGAMDLRGKTTIRGSAAILAASRLYIGQAGFLMHLARAVDCRSVIVYGGRENPLISGYVANENIVGRTVCAPCWQRTRCDYGHACMQMIDPDAVILAAKRQFALAGTPLPVEQVMIYRSE